MNTKVYGLTEEEVIKNRKKYGSNELVYEQKNSFFKLLIESLGDPIIKILLIALGIKIVFLFKSFDWYETLGIIIAIFVASFISSISEYGSERAFERLQSDFYQSKSKVKRNGKIVEINSSDIVVNDIVFLSSGDRIPADGHIIEGELTVDESSLNGESGDVYKCSVNPISLKINDDNKVYKGTSVYSKEAIVMIDKVGVNTIYGKIAEELSINTSDSPLKQKLRGLAKIISRIGYIGAFLISFSYLFSVIVINNNFNITKITQVIMNWPLMLNYFIYALTLCVTIIVVAVPEGLPMMITLVLSSNMKNMLKNNVLVRKLVGIETAGSLNILFTDKTGTITKGNLEVIGIIDGEEHTFNSELELIGNKTYYRIVKNSAILNNDSCFDEYGNIVGGNITDQSLLRFFTLNKREWNYEKIQHIPFDSKSKYSITMIDDDKKTKFIKGNHETLLRNCSYYINKNGDKKRFYKRQNIEKVINNYTNSGIRVIVLAQSTNVEINDINNLTYIATVLIKDEIRQEAKTGIELIENAGIQTIMITGDNKNTAISIAKEIGIIKNASDIVITSQELANMEDKEIAEKLLNIRVIARSLPQDKSRLIKIAQSLSLVVGMTGDGVNDAPALKKADVGFSMGSGTEVAREASDIVILDDNLLSISKAILFGRTIFKSIRKFIIVQLTINLCAMGLSLICPFIGIDAPVTIVQMLWVNMVMDTLAGLSFAFEPPLLEYMKEKPKRKEEPIINRYMINQILISGIYATILCIFFLKSPFISSFFLNSEHLMTAFFGLFIFIDILNGFNARTTRINILANIQKNKVFILIMGLIIIVQIILIYKGGVIFRTTGLTIKEFIIMLIAALTVIPIDWTRKRIFKMKHSEIVI